MKEVLGCDELSAQCVEGMRDFLCGVAAGEMHDWARVRRTGGAEQRASEAAGKLGPHCTQAGGAWAMGGGRVLTASPSKGRRRAEL